MRTPKTIGYRKGDVELIQFIIFSNNFVGKRVYIEL